jgi:hypothetical protein
LPTDASSCIHLTHVVTQAGYDKIEWQGKWHSGNTPQDYGFPAHRIHWMLATICIRPPFPTVRWKSFTTPTKNSFCIPLIISNPKQNVCGQEMHSLISALDIVPTMANLLGVSGAFESFFYGTSLVEVLDNPGTCPNAMVHFTYNDIPSRNAPSIILCVGTLRYKYAMFFTSNGNDTDWELYDLQRGSR